MKSPFSAALTVGIANALLGGMSENQIAPARSGDRSIKAMVNIELIGQAIALAISKTGKYRAEEQAIVMQVIAKGDEKAGIPPCDAADLIETLTRVGNISQDRQEMEKSGILLSKAHTPNALAQQVKAALKAANVDLPVKVS